MQRRYSTVKEMPKYYPVFSEATIRSLIFNRNTNGLAPCLRKVGKKVLIDLDMFAKWIDDQKDFKN